MHPIKSVIFDLDGTLLNTISYIASCMNQVLSDGGYPTHPVDSYRKFVGDGIDMLVRRALPERVRNDREIALRKTQMLAIYDNHTKETVQPYDGVPEMLHALEEKGIVLSILSNKIHRYTVTAQQNILPEFSFARVLGARENVPMKPHPDGALEIARYTGIAPEQTLFVGDMKADILTAKNAGMQSAGVTWGFGTEEMLRSLNADYIIHHPSELVALV